MKLNITFSGNFLFYLLLTLSYTSNADGQKIRIKKPTKSAQLLDDYEYKNWTCRRWETAAEYPTCDAGWANYLVNTIDSNLPKKNGAPPGSYIVEVEIIFQKDGSIMELKPTTHYGFGMEEELIRVIRQSPKWRSATYNGRFVKGYRKQKFCFTVSNLLITCNSSTHQLSNG